MNQSETASLASPSCKRCKGLGITYPKSKESPCLCVYRAIFRACFQKFKDCTATQRSVFTVNLDHVGSGLGRRRMVYGHKCEEFMADFHLTAKRTLTTIEWQLFSFHYLLGADWKACCQRLGIDRGQCFHAFYRIEQKLGRAFIELEPYSLFSTDQYFAPGGKEVSAFIPTPAMPQPLRPPLASRV